MANNLVKKTWYDWRRHHNVVQSVNFAFGIILVIMTLVLLIAGERLGANNSHIYMLGICSVLALWAGVTESERRVYVIDMLIGLLFISSFTSI